MQHDEYKRVKQAAQYLGVSASTIWLFTKQQKIKSIKLSERVTVWAKSELDAFISSRTIQYSHSGSI